MDIGYSHSNHNSSYLPYLVIVSMRWSVRLLTLVEITKLFLKRVLLERKLCHLAFVEFSLFEAVLGVGLWVV
jgi:hypothetical protein